MPEHGGGRQLPFPLVQDTYLPQRREPHRLPLYIGVAPVEGLGLELPQTVSAFLDAYNRPWRAIGSGRLTLMCLLPKRGSIRCRRVEPVRLWAAEMAPALAADNGT